MVIFYGIIGALIQVKLVRLWTKDPTLPYFTVILWRICYSLVIWNPGSIVGLIYLTNNLHNLSPAYDYILGFICLLLLPIVMEILVFKILCRLERFSGISWRPWRIKVLVLSIPICVLSYLVSYGFMVIEDMLL
jgi:hypothetical protein